MLRLSEDELRALQARINRPPAPKAAKRRNKYGAEPVTIDGIRFDSKAEGRRYLQLKAMQGAGEISGLRHHVEFPLLPAQAVGERKEKPVHYEADFVYLDSAGNQIVEDTKSAPTKTKEFVLKRKLMLWIHGIAVKEVMAT